VDHDQGNDNRHQISIYENIKQSVACSSAFQDKPERDVNRIKRILSLTATATCFLLFNICFQGCSACPTQPGGTVTIPDPVAEWSFDETSGSVVHDSSIYDNNGVAVGTMIVPGRFGNARQFNGNGDYVYVPDPINGAFDSGQNQSFTVDLWFKTTSDSLQDIIRKGSAPIAGFFIQTDNGKVNAGLGADVNSPPPDSIITIESTLRFNDGKWHEVRFIRDRQRQKLYLLVDGVQAAPPIAEAFPELVANTQILTIGRWENQTYPLYFSGTIDEIKIWNEAVYQKTFPRLHHST
jgi:hypothetical protein